MGCHWPFIRHLRSAPFLTSIHCQSLCLKTDRWWCLDQQKRHNHSHRLLPVVCSRHPFTRRLHPAPFIRHLTSRQRQYLKTERWWPPACACLAQLELLSLVCGTRVCIYYLGQDRSRGGQHSATWLCVLRLWLFGAYVVCICFWLLPSLLSSVLSVRLTKSGSLKKAWALSWNSWNFKSSPEMSWKFLHVLILVMSWNFLAQL